MDIQLVKLYLRVIKDNWLVKDCSEVPKYDVIENLWMPINGYNNNFNNEHNRFSVFHDAITYTLEQAGEGIWKRIFKCKSDEYLSQPFVGIGNVRIDNHSEYFDCIRTGRSNITEHRYSNLSEAINTVIRYRSKTGQKTNLFVLPEAYVPYAWLSTLASTSKKNDMAILAGLEHIKYKDKFYNFTVAMFPVTVHNFTMVHINFHLKVRYAPVELKEFDKKTVSGSTYEMYEWRGLKIAPYSCYELTSIGDRALFKKDGVNLIAAIVFNRDVEYFSNIIESLSRDMNCFVVQANDSMYGDSRVVQPARKFHKNIMRFSGGVNFTALISQLDLAGLRNHLKRPLFIQMEDNKWKPKAPE
jgi:hypothetical protein